MANKRGNGEGTVFYSERLKRWIAQFNYGRKPDEEYHGRRLMNAAMDMSAIP